ncbi:MAG: DUF167 domain-containing protein [Isosphaeraceae bacterium]
MIDVQSHAQGSVLPVRAKPGAKTNALQGEHGGALRVAVSAAPEAGKANEAVIKVLSETLDVARARITLISGASSRSKRFLIAGLPPDVLLMRINAALSPTLSDSSEPEV